MCNDHIDINIYSLCKFQPDWTIITILVLKLNFPLKSRLDFKPTSTGYFRYKYPAPNPFPGTPILDLHLNRPDLTIKPQTQSGDHRSRSPFQEASFYIVFLL